MAEPRDDNSTPSPGADLAAEFEALRPQLTRVAYGMLGSLAEAEDIVQEAWLRLGRADRAAIEDLRAWLTTVVGRLALDALGSARARRESYVGEWLPEPLVEEYEEDNPTLDEAVSTALLVVLERLSPAERTAFLLHDVFELPFDKVGEVVGRSPAAVRQLAARARAHVEEGKPRFPADAEEEQRIVTAFALAWLEGDHEALLDVLDPEAGLGQGQVELAQAALAAHAGVEEDDPVAALDRPGVPVRHPRPGQRQAQPPDPRQHLLRPRRVSSCVPGHRRILSGIPDRRG